MLTKEKEDEILQHALNALKANIALHVEIETEELELQHYPNIRADYRLGIVINGTEMQFYAEVKTNITNVVLAQAVINKVAEAQLANVLLVTKYVTPQLADKLRQENIQFKLLPY